MNTNSEENPKNKFKKELDKAEKLIKKKQFEEALCLLEKMKNYDNDLFDDNLVHNFFMLYSNVQSVVRGKKIYENLLSLSRLRKKASYKEIFEYLKEKNIILDMDTIKKEVEILILGDKAPWKANKDTIFFKE